MYKPMDSNELKENLNNIKSWLDIQEPPEQLQCVYKSLELYWSDPEDIPSINVWIMVVENVVQHVDLKSPIVDQFG